MDSAVNVDADLIAKQNAINSPYIPVGNFFPVVKYKFYPDNSNELYMIRHLWLMNILTINLSQRR